ncbi:MAG: DUF2974 domain-containing protein [Ruminococcaceae bacterium]|nr:DUF2974 domain-containing protein [Oscillospiraceae bacterium]
MANILDYLDWRGDLSFDAAPMNEVDSFIIAKIGCPDYTGLIPENSDSVYLCDAVEAYFARGEADNLGLLAAPLELPMLRRLAETPRFSHLLLTRFVTHMDLAKNEQYSALTVRLPDGTRYITFRGTDDTLVSWKENFLMTVEQRVHAQTDAAAYLLEEARSAPGKFYIGGHSKGGNLAVYAAMHAPEDIQERIIGVYSYDGPGFRTSILDDPRYVPIRDRVVTICPQRSIVGMLMHQETRLTIVESDAYGIGAHDGFTWQVRGTQFVRCDELSRSSRAVRASALSLLESLSDEEKREAIEGLFGLLSDVGAERLNDLNEQRLRKLVELARGMRSSPAVSSVLSEMIEGVVHEYIDDMKDDVKDGLKGTLKIGLQKTKSLKHLRIKRRE